MVAFLNNGAGDFSSALVLGSLPYTRSLEVFDKDGDGDLIAKLGSGRYVYLNPGGPGWTAPLTLPSLYANFTLGDVNGDGIHDVLHSSNSV